MQIDIPWTGAAGEWRVAAHAALRDTSAFLSNDLAALEGAVIGRFTVDGSMRKWADIGDRPPHCAGLAQAAEI